MFRKIVIFFFAVIAIGAFVDGINRGKEKSEARTNKAHEMLSALDSDTQKTMLTQLFTSSNEECKVTYAFFQGLDDATGDAFWNVRCEKGKSLSIQIRNDDGGSVIMLECSILQAVAGVECFVPLKGQ